MWDVAVAEPLPTDAVTLVYKKTKSSWDGAEIPAGNVLVRKQVTRIRVWDFKIRVKG